MSQSIGTLKKTMANRALTLFFVLLATMATYAQNKKIDSLKQLLKEDLRIERKIDLFNSIAMEYRRYKIDSVLYYGDKMLDLSKENSYPKGENLAYHIYGHYYFFTSNYVKASEFFYKALNGSLKINDNEEIMNNYDMVSGTYFMQNNIEGAITYSNKYIDLAEAMGHEQNICTGMNNLALIYSSLDDHEKAIALRLKIKANNFCENKFLYLGGLANSYLQLGSFDKALDNAKQAEEHIKGRGNHFQLSYLYDIYGEIYYKMNSLPKAMEYYGKTINLKRKGMEVFDLSVKKSAYGAAMIYNQTNQLDSAIASARMSYDLSLTSGDLDYQYKNAKFLNNLYEKTNQKEAAFEYMDLALHLADSLDSEGKIADIYKQIIESEKEAAQQQRQDELKINRLQSTKKLLMAIFASTALMGLLFVVRNRRLIKEKNKAESSLKEKVQLEKNIRQIEDSMASDFQENFSNKLSGLNSLKQMLGNSTTQKDATISKYSNKLEQSLDLLINDLNDLLWAFSSKNNLVASLMEKLDNVIEKFNKKTGKQVTLQFLTDRPYTLPNFANKQLLFSLKEIINNFDKYAGTEQLKIVFSIKDHHLKINAKDQGKGFDINQLKRINGLNNIKKRIESLNLSIAIDSEPGKGVEYSISGDL